jgi:hypothetical protein
VTESTAAGAFDLSAPGGPEQIANIHSRKRCQASDNAGCHQLRGSTSDREVALAAR